MSTVVVRPYDPVDRPNVRSVCFQTGYMGEPVDWQWRDAESFADVFSGYYTDREPESAQVVELDGEVAGYLLGCLDSRTAWNPASVVLRHVMRRGIAFRPGTAGFLWRSGRDTLHDLVRRHPPPSAVLDSRWPAHLHINLLPGARGKGAGGTMVHRWLDTLRSHNVAGCHLETLAENVAAIAFFDAMGFRRHGAPTTLPGMRSPHGARHHLQLMVQALDQPSPA
jgi:ribosomal protein S18 acetylase RimI-like enzyme